MWTKVNISIKINIHVGRALDILIASSIDAMSLANDDNNEIMIDNDDNDSPSNFIRFWCPRRSFSFFLPRLSVPEISKRYLITYICHVIEFMYVSLFIFSAIVYVCPNYISSSTRKYLDEEEEIIFYSRTQAVPFVKENGKSNRDSRRSQSSYFAKLDFFDSE